MGDACLGSESESSEGLAAHLDNRNVDSRDAGIGSPTRSRSIEETTSGAASGLLEQSAPAGSGPVSHGRLLAMLYTSHGLSRWGNRMWEFAVVLLLLGMASGSLRLVSIHGVLQCIAMVILGFPIGKLVDHSGRLLLALSVVTAQNVALVIAALLSSILTTSSFNQEMARGPRATLWDGIVAEVGFILYIVGIAIVLFLSAVASVASMGRGIAIERDWVVVLSMAHRDGLETAYEAEAEEECNAPESEEKVNEVTALEDTSNISKIDGRHPGALGEVTAAQRLSGGAEAEATEDYTETSDLLPARRKAESPAQSEAGQDAAPVRRERQQEQEKALQSGLASMNSMLKAIDLTCRLAAPALVGLFMSYLPLPSCCLLLAIWNAASFPLEAWLLAKLYQACPLLQGSPCRSPSCGTQIGQRCDRGWRDSTCPSHHDDPECNATVPQTKERHPSQKRLLDEMFGWITDAIDMIKVYFRQPALFPALSLAFLYLTVLSFGDVLTAYLKVQGIPAGLLGLLSAAAALTGILGTAIFSLACQRFGVARTGQLASFLQWICLLPSAVLAGMAAGRYAISPWPLVVSVVSSRIGLWMFDLAALQIVQVGVIEGERGQVGGVQEALQQVMEIMSFTICIAADSPIQFWIPVLVSFGSISASSLLFQAYCFVT